MMKKHRTYPLHDFFPTNPTLQSVYPVELDSNGLPTGDFAADLVNQARGRAATKIQSKRAESVAAAKVLHEILIADGIQTMSDEALTGLRFDTLSSHMHRTDASGNIRCHERARRFKIAGVINVTVRGSGMFEKWKVTH